MDRKSGVLVDKRFSIPTSKTKKCVGVAQKLITVFGMSQSSNKCKAFSSWLVHALEDIIQKVKRCNGLLNAQQLWSKYHKFTISQNLKQRWEEFLDSCNADREPML